MSIIEPIIGERQCSKCRACKPVTEFHRKRGGYATACKPCTCAAVAGRYKAKKTDGLWALAPFAGAHRVWQAVDRKIRAPLPAVFAPRIAA
ncbi:hypothetical protein ACFQZQ_03045 [Lysobacter koreensis]|uniref:Uncharacterized protein n=1 Tax=Lysobacter koreensis TaxID=266122 RepID=A0ABW2YKA6_9GAMM